ncbi:ankyrin repeat and SOCS box protein 9-like [Electrophorus electricus]|uniref:ankyrin repeat and SOCS box protein 9-like n=1 Tax=Electrophorus electricus TaxID=8005 RepID=UPI0015CF8B98|nr:ankyrin repeat and SOCS box protein 9-like [Electrophorus electricus]
MSEPQRKRDGQELHSGAAVYFSNPLMSDAEADWAAVHDAAFNGRLLVLHGLTRQVNASTMSGSAPLSEASSKGHVTCVNLLRHHGATHQTPNPSTEEKFITPNRGTAPPPPPHSSSGNPPTI